MLSRLFQWIGPYKSIPEPTPIETADINDAPKPWLKYCELKNIYGIEFPIPIPNKVDLLSMEDIVEMQKMWLQEGQRLIDNKISKMFEFLYHVNNGAEFKDTSPYKYLDLNIQEIRHTTSDPCADYTNTLYTNNDAPSQIKLHTFDESIIEVEIENKKVLSVSNWNGHTRLGTFIPGQWIFELENLVQTLENSKTIQQTEALKDERYTLSAITSTLNR